MSKGRVLIAEDEEISRDNLEHVLRKEGYEVTAVPDGAKAIKALESQDFDVVLTDLRMPGVGGMEVLESVKTMRPNTEVLILTGYATVETAVAAMNRGAYNYLSKPYKLEEVKALLRKAMEKSGLRRQLAELRDKMNEGSAPLIIGQSQRMRELRKSIAQVGEVDSTVLIQGETGTGKELVARAIHAMSPRRDKRFMGVNCAAFTEELLANELFGHERDAFTGAHKQRKGLIEIADGGTFFLDEVGDMPQAMQVKMLRVLEERALLRVGGTEEIPINVRIIAATNKDLKAEVEEGAFRRDLFYRLNVIVLTIPPLSERREDIPLLASHFVAKHAKRMGKPEVEFSPDAMGILENYEYPGNVRELENIVESALVMCREGFIQPGHLPPDLQRRQVFLTRESDGGFSAMKSLRELEDDYIDWILEQTANNKTRAAEILGIDRASLWRKLQARKG